MKTVVIYHRSDFDGIFCREIARKFLGNNSDVTFLGWDYGDPTPGKDIIDGTEQLYMLDISISDLMDHPRLIWIDHHRIAMDRWDNPESRPIGGYRIDGVAACRLAWQWFSRGWKTEEGLTQFPLPEKQHFFERVVREPLAVRLAGEYDIWDKRDPSAELFQDGLRSQDLSHDDWSALFEWPEEYSGKLVNRLLSKGRGIQFYRRTQAADAIARCGYTVEWEGLKFLACNWGAGRFNSLSFTAGIKPEHDALLGYRFDGKRFSISLYHAPGKEQHDLSAIAKKYGGGGHRGACGFIVEMLPKEILPIDIFA